MRPIKVAHVTTVDLSLRYLLLNQLCSLQQAGYEVIGISAPGPDVGVLEAAGIRHISVPMTRSFTPLADLGALRRLYQVMRNERFDIVHTHTPKPGLLGQLAARLAGVPVVVNTIHGFYFHDNMPAARRRFYITMEQIAARCSDVLLSQNREDIEAALKHRICGHDRIEALGNGIDLQHFDPDRYDQAALIEKAKSLRLSPGAPVVGFVGRLVAEKGILELLQAVKAVLAKVPAARFLLIGPLDTGKADALSPQIASDYGIEAACIFTGHRLDMPELYALMDVFVLPSHREGFPRSCMEASAMGVPCIATDIRGCREVVKVGCNGLLVPLGDVSALAAAIIELLTDQEKARAMGAEGRRIARERFDERLVFNKVRATYARLLWQKGLPVPASA